MCQRMKFEDVCQLCYGLKIISISHFMIFWRFPEVTAKNLFLTELVSNLVGQRTHASGIVKRDH